LPLLLIAAIALPIDGCGGGSRTAAKSGQSNGSGEAQAQFIAQADSICHRVNAEIVSFRAKSGSASEVKRIVPRTLSIERRALATLTKLNPPASLADDWQKMLGYRGVLANQLANLLHDAERNDGSSIKSLGAAKKRIHASLSGTAKASGFKDCAKVGSV